jgi:hypothetical protein
MSLPTPHFEKLVATLANDKLPASDRPRIEQAIDRYREWISELDSISRGTDESLEKMVLSLNKYKFYIDLELIFDSSEDFLYRQKGQLKLDNSIIEEFLPWLTRPCILPNLSDSIYCGPVNCFSSLYFSSSLAIQLAGGGMGIRTKDQDFGISRKIYIQCSHNQDLSSSASGETYLAYVACEIKTNLDKTMFQEACATAHDVKIGVPSAKYFLLCEWLDMTPLSTVATDIEEILLLRGSKRLGSNERKYFATFAGRQRQRDFYADYLRRSPFRADVFKRFVNHIQRLLDHQDPIEDDVLGKGYF